MLVGPREGTLQVCQLGYRVYMFTSRGNVGVAIQLLTGKVMALHYLLPELDRIGPRTCMPVNHFPLVTSTVNGIDANIVTLLARYI